MPGAFLSSHRGRISNAAASRLYAGRHLNCSTQDLILFLHQIYFWGSALYDGEFGGPVDGINLEEIKEFAKQFKMKRLSLGLTQTQVGQALSLTDGPAYSQSAICRLVSKSDAFGFPYWRITSELYLEGSKNWTSRPNPLRRSNPSLRDGWRKLMINSATAALHPSNRLIPVLTAPHPTTLYRRSESAVLRSHHRP